MSEPLDAWLAQGSAAEADWPEHVRRLALRGELGWAGDALLLDLPALAQPHACRSASCAPGLRAAGSRSCCADLEVELTPDEAAALDAALPELHAAMAPHDARWRDSPPARTEGALLLRPGGRCVYALASGHGLSCALHRVEDQTGRPRGALKPMPCRLFPLVVVDLGDGHTLLTAVHRSTARYTGLRTAAFPCLLGDDRASLARSAQDTLAELWGAPVARAILRATRRWRAAAA